MLPHFNSNLLEQQFLIYELNFIFKAINFVADAQHLSKMKTKQQLYGGKVLFP